MKETLLIIDGSSLLYRAFYAIPSLTDSQGRPTNAVYGFLNMLLKLYEQLEPHYVAVAFDKDKHTFRNDLYDGYKATRKPAPDDLRPQFPLIREVLECLGIHVLELEGYEGDDIIGTVARQMEAKDFHIDIVTGDRDALQLVDENVTVHLTKKGITNMLAVTPDVMTAEYGYAPSQVVDMKALMGDTADNIPGVPGVGEKTAAKLIAQFQHVEALYDRIDEVKGKKLQEKLTDNKDKAFLSKELATICCSAPVEYTLDMFLPQPRKEDVAALFRSLGFKNMLARFAAFDRFASLADEGPEQDVSLQLLDDLRPQDLAGQIVAVEGVYEPAAPLPAMKALAIAGRQGVFVVPAGREGEYLRALADAALVVTSQGKQLVKAASPYTDKRLPLADIVLAAYLLDPTRTAYGLAYLSEKFAVPLQEGDDEALRLAGDAQFSFDVWPKAAEALEQAGLTTLYDTIEIPLIHTLAVMEMNGFTVDTERLMDMERELSLEADKLEEEIYDDAGETFNINSTKQLGVILFEKLGLPVIKKTKTGYSTDSAVLEALMEQHPMIPKILQFRALKKLISTYLDGLEPLISRETGRIYTSFNQMVTATGRLSSSDPNLQNIPIRTEQGRKIRSLFVPGEGYDYIVSGDYSQIELRLLAHLSQDPTMIDGFKKNQDIHRRTASEVFGIPWDEVTPEQRSHAKAVNFGIIYGISDFGLSEDLGISVYEARRYMQNYFATYPGVKRFMDDCVAFAKENGYVKTLYGRKRYIPELQASVYATRAFGERVAMNMPLQGTASDIIKAAMIEVDKKLAEGGYKAKLIMQVHDELIVDCPLSEKDNVEKLLKTCMQNVAELSVPLIADVGSGENWLEAK